MLDGNLRSMFRPASSSSSLSQYHYINIRNSDDELLIDRNDNIPIISYSRRYMLFY
jgi:hypothetical protein